MKEWVLNSSAFVIHEVLSIRCFSFCFVIPTYGPEIWRYPVWGPYSTSQMIRSRKTCSSRPACFCATHCQNNTTSPQLDFTLYWPWPLQKCSGTSAILALTEAILLLPPAHQWFPQELYQSRKYCLTQATPEPDSSVTLSLPRVSRVWVQVKHCFLTSNICLPTLNSPF